MSKTVWILADDRAGNVNQLLGVASALDWETKRIDIRYTDFVKLPNIIRDKTLIGLTKKSRSLLQQPYPDIVLSAGRRSFPIARWIQKKSHNKTKIIQLMNPGYKGFCETDLIILPTHDQYKKQQKNVFIVTGTPHQLTSERLQTERQNWEPFFKKYPHKRLSLIVGGATKNNPFTLEMAKQLLSAVQKLNPASVLVTTSRRTPPEIVSFLQSHLPPQTTYFYTFGCADKNPYFGLISCADMIMVTGDSMSMCSECCSTTVPVFIFAPDEMISEKHKRFHQSLYADGFALPAGSDIQAVKGNFNPAQQIAEKIKELFK
ncbi:MAG: mitochondrial fission ELM1 family protein [Alphaproteobacteria bacterium]|nr:mitochondrial fission ELM1 family protein [Alphaproteobacteria bacterium]